MIKLSKELKTTAIIATHNKDFAIKFDYSYIFKNKKPNNLIVGLFVFTYVSIL